MPKILFTKCDFKGGAVNTSAHSQTFILSADMYQCPLHTGRWGYGSERTQGKKAPPSSAFNLERDGTGN